MRKAYDWSAVQRYHDEGHSRNACMERFGFKLDAWYKAVRRGSLAAKVERHSIDWGAVQRFYDLGNSYRECRIEFGFAAESWRKAIRRGVLRARSNRWPLERILQESKSRASIKRRLLEAGVLKNVCDECGLSDWRGRALSIQLDHRNGNRADHRLENLRMLCPNCHSQTSTFGARNRKKKPRAANHESFPGGVIGNTPDSESGDSRFETLPGSQFFHGAADYSRPLLVYTKPG
jgi:hypothetical protein